MAIKTKYNALVTIKKDAMDRCERTLQEANKTVTNAQNALSEAIEGLNHMSLPEEGSAFEFTQFRAMLDAQRILIKERENWVAFAKEQAKSAQEAFKEASIEYEKFKYLDDEEKARLIKTQQIKEQKLLDELAILGTLNENSD